jgi:hypothetical protein
MKEKERMRKAMQNGVPDVHPTVPNNVIQITPAEAEQLKMLAAAVEQRKAQHIAAAFDLFRGQQAYEQAQEALALAHGIVPTDERAKGARWALDLQALTFTRVTP